MPIHILYLFDIQMNKNFSKLAFFLIDAMMVRAETKNGAV